MTVSLARCIYCGRFFNPRIGEGDHVITASLGEFQGAQTFRGDCRSCNNAFGRFDEQLTKSSPLGLYRSFVRPKLRRRGSPMSWSQRESKGARKPRFHAQFIDRSIVVDRIEGEPKGFSPVDQLVLRDDRGIDHHIRLYAGMSANRLKADFDKLGIASPKELWFMCEPDQTEHVKSLISAIFPKSQIVEEGEIDEGNQSAACRGEFVVTIEYFQAIAKMAFHYYLIHNRRGYRGHETIFAPLRRFIKKGGDKDRFFRSSGKEFRIPFRQTSTGAICPTKWFHALAAEEANGWIVVYVHLFVGPEGIPRPHYVTLGMIDQSIVIPRPAWGRVFEYDPTRVDNYAGQVTEASLTRFR